MKKYLICFLILLFVSPVGAVTYTVDDANGTDAGTCVGASPSTECKTIQYVLDNEDTDPNDIIEIEEGTYREEIIPGADDVGSSGNPLIIRGKTGHTVAVAASDDILASGCDQAGDWTETGTDGLWECAYAANNQLFINGARQTEDATPDTEGEWNHDGTNVEVFTATGVNNPVGYSDWSTMEVSQRNTAFYIATGRDWITIKDLTAKHGNNVNSGTIQGDDVQGLVIQNVTATYGDGHGVLYGTDADNCELSGSTVSYNNKSGVLAYKVAASSGNENIIKENTFNNNGEMGIYIWANWTIVEKNLVQNNGNVGAVTAGIEVFNGDDDGYGQDNIVRYNWINGQISGTDDGEGIYADEETLRTYIYGNIIYNNDGPGIAIFDANYAYVYNNTLYGNCQDSSGELTTFSEIKVIATIQGDTTYPIIKNNIAQATEANTYAIYVDAETEGATGIDISNNDWFASATNWYFWNGGGGDTLATWNAFTGVGTDQEGDPLMTNPGSDDLTLQSTSPAIDAGVGIAGYGTKLRTDASWPSSVTTTPVGNRNDIGAYEDPVWGAP